MALTSVSLCWRIWLSNNESSSRLFTWTSRMVVTGWIYRQMGRRCWKQCDHVQSLESALWESPRRWLVGYGAECDELGNLAGLHNLSEDMDELWRSTSLTRATSSVSRWRMRSWVMAINIFRSWEIWCGEGRTVQLISIFLSSTRRHNVASTVPGVPMIVDGLKNYTLSVNSEMDGAWIQTNPPIEARLHAQTPAWQACPDRRLYRFLGYSPQEQIALGRGTLQHRLGHLYGDLNLSRALLRNVHGRDLLLHVEFLSIALVNGLMIWLR